MITIAKYTIITIARYTTITIARSTTIAIARYTYYIHWAYLYKRLSQNDHINQMITLSVMTLSGCHCICTPTMYSFFNLSVKTTIVYLCKLS